VGAALPTKSLSNEISSTLPPGNDCCYGIYRQNLTKAKCEGQTSVHLVREDAAGTQELPQSPYPSVFQCKKESPTCSSCAPLGNLQEKNIVTWSWHLSHRYIWEKHLDYQRIPSSCF